METAASSFGPMAIISSPRTSACLVGFNSYLYYYYVISGLLQGFCSTSPRHWPNNNDLLVGACTSMICCTWIPACTCMYSLQCRALSAQAVINMQVLLQAESEWALCVVFATVSLAT